VRRWGGVIRAAWWAPAPPVDDSDVDDWLPFPNEAGDLTGAILSSMSDSIHTESVAYGFAVADEVVLSETARTRTVFRPEIHSGGVRGHLIRQKRSEDGSWLNTNEVNFAQVPPDCGVRIELDTEATKRLFTKLDKLHELQAGQGVRHGDHTFVVVEEDEVVIVTDHNKAAVIKALLERGLSEEFWAALNDADPDLASKLAAGTLQSEREQALNVFRLALTESPGDEAVWQQFFEEEHWILQLAFSSLVYYLGGEVYLGGKRATGRQGKGGVATDFLFSDDSTKSFAIVEIKTPETELVHTLYRGQSGSGLHNETYSIHPDLTGGVVQTHNQISVAIEEFQSVLGASFEKLNRVHPAGILIAGTAEGLTPRELDSLNHFRHGLNGLTVITYDELLKRLESMLAAPDQAAAASPGKGDDPVIPF
jgi:Domain of unknown function (DUF4263)